MKEIEHELAKLFDKYHLSSSDRDNFKKISKDIYNHHEFKRRMSNEFLHHDDVSLASHILEDSVLTYILSKKYLNKNSNSNYRIDLAVKISMLHDLYTIPWQNNPEAHVYHFFSKHGFRHPVESAINAILWYPYIFQDKMDSEIIIDGILHHMFPLPVRRINKKINKVELKNMSNYLLLSRDYKRIINNSLKRGRIGILSFSRSKYKEGRIMAKADRIVSRKQIKNFESFKALLTGTNKKLNKENK